MPTRKNSHGRPEIRQKEALTRQDSYDKLTTQQKIDKLNVGNKNHPIGFFAIKQRDKLYLSQQSNYIKEEVDKMIVDEVLKKAKKIRKLRIKK